MKTLREAIRDYLALRRSLGFKLKKHQRFLGSAQEFVGTCILGGLLKNDEFSLCGCHALSLEQQIA
jgi:hypothetical protein